MDTVPNSGNNSSRVAKSEIVVRSRQDKWAQFETIELINLVNRNTRNKPEFMLPRTRKGLIALLDLLGEYAK